MAGDSTVSTVTIKATDNVSTARSALNTMTDTDATDNMSVFGVPSSTMESYNGATTTYGDVGTTTTGRILNTTTGAVVDATTTDDGIFGTTNVDTSISVVISTIFTTARTLVENPIAIYSTVAGSDSTEALSGFESNEYPPDNGPSKVFDQNLTTSYRICGLGKTSASGTKTGFYLTPVRGPFTLSGVRFATSLSNNQRDPIAVTIEGSNETSQVMLTLGSSWQFLYGGSTGLEPVSNRQTYGSIQVINNTQMFESYRVLVASKRGVDSCVEYSEVEFLS